MNNIDPASSIRLWQLLSPSLPIGAYAYSQGLETAVENNWITDEAAAQQWLTGILSHCLSKLDAPVMVRLFRAWQAKDLAALVYWNQFLLACRESSELYHEDQQIGQALLRLLKDIMSCGENQQHARQFALIQDIDSPGYALVYTLASVIWAIPLEEAIRGFLWSWCENQVAASIKLIPLGQTAGQRILGNLITPINQGTAQALELEDNDISSLAPGFAIVCARHEVQYSRLFRS